MVGSMSKPNKRKYNSFFIREFNQNEEVDMEPQYHYTSPDGFLSIVKNNCLRFTDISFLNNVSESIYMLKVICDYFCEYPQKFPRVEEAFFEMIKENKPEDIANLNVREVKYQLPLPIIKQRQFVFCMCNECDKLNMWNYYVNNGVYQGYNIGFNVQELIRSFDVEEDILDSFLVYYGNVLYKKAEQYKFLKNRFKKLEEVHKNDENLNHLTIKLRMFIDSFCAFFKHPKFEEEKEFRIVIEIADARIPRTDNHFVGPYNKKMKYDFYTKNGLIIPCLYVKINKQSFSRITVSPIMEAEITKMSIRELLSTNGYKGCRVYQSTIPIRF